jgi:hypothetical protein
MTPEPLIESPEVDDAFEEMWAIAGAVPMDLPAVVTPRFYGRRRGDGSGPGSMRKRANALLAHLASGALGGLLAGGILGLVFHAAAAARPTIEQTKVAAVALPAPGAVVPEATKPIAIEPPARAPMLPQPRPARAAPRTAKSPAAEVEEPHTALEQAMAAVPAVATAPAEETAAVADDDSDDAEPLAGQALALTEAQVMAVATANRAAVEDCVARQRAEEPGSKGRLMMRWDVLPDGTTDNIAAETPELEDSTLTTCLVGLVRSWTFPEHAGAPQAVRFPFTF